MLQESYQSRGEASLHRLKEAPQGSLTAPWIDYSVHLHLQSCTSHTPSTSKSWLFQGFYGSNLYIGTHCMIISFRFFHFAMSLANPLSTFCLPKTVDTSCPFSFYCVLSFFYSLIALGGVSGWNVSKYIYSTSDH